MTTPNKPNIGYWIIAVIALIWNAMGVFQYYSSYYMQDSWKDTVSAEEFALFTGMPGWYNIVFAISVFTGLIGCLLLLLRKKFAIVFFALSLLTVLVSQGYWLLGTDAMNVVGPQSVIMPLVVIIISIFLYFYSKGAAQKGWLR